MQNCSQTGGATVSTAGCLDSSPVSQFPYQMDKEWIEKENLDGYVFMIRRIEDDQPLGFIELDGIDWQSRNGWVGIAIGERENWGKGYGTDAFRILIRFAFRELNLRRLSLTVFEYNPVQFVLMKNLASRSKGETGNGCIVVVGVGI
jgi:RimJ/RimL family protein N-acetyltransferase